MCPPVVGIANSPEIAKKRAMCFRRADTQARPYGESGEWEEVIRRILSFEYPILSRKLVYFVATPASPFMHHMDIFSVGRTYVSARGRHCEFARNR